MDSKKKHVIVIFMLLAFCEISDTMGFGKFKKLFPLQEEEKKCFRRQENSKDKDDKGNQVSEKVMTSSQEPSSPTSSDEYTTSLDVQESTSAILSPGVSTDPATDCEQWHRWNNSCYNFVNTTRVGWNEAAKKCSSMREGAHLVFIESKLEDEEISRLAKVASEGRNERWWIGLTKENTEGVWKWYNVSANYMNWATNQPDNYLGRENCGELYGLTGDSAAWNDNLCYEHHYFICEKNVTENMN